MERFDAFCFRYRNVLAAAPLLIALALPRPAGGSALAAWIVGGVLALVGVELRALCVCYNKYAQRERKNLATTGPYAQMRNPLYIGNGLIILGAATASQHYWLVPVMLVWCGLVYSRVIAHEERRLIDKYGDEFLAYRESTPRWVPRLPEGFGPALIRQSAGLVLLIPFLLKQLFGP